jgi:hypothetical protein
VRTIFEQSTRTKSRRLADLKTKTADLERKLSHARGSLERELAEFTGSWDLAATRLREAPAGDLADAGHDLSGGRTEVLVNHGRRSAYTPGLSRSRKIAIAAAAVAVVVTVLVVVLAGGGASWPPSVATVQGETSQACHNPDVSSEPGQVNFACGKSTRQILWVFAFLTSADNPSFTDPKTNRQGLEPIAPGQGGEVAWSLNLHHPYRPANPVDSLEVAARAINNIIGGATLVDAKGNTVVQPGLESSAANCARYTGSAALSSRTGYPSLCASPVTSAAGQAALVADVYQKWVVGAAHTAAQDAAVLFTHANDPGDPAVQAILRHLSQAKLLA